jgi:peptide-methionine (R)-S-oxide reductase
MDERFTKKLSKEQHNVMAEKGTEVPFTGKFVHHKANGMYTCAACGIELFDSKSKFDSGTGWPSFTDAKNIELKKDFSHGMIRTEVVCKNCRGHLGHLFNDGPNGKKRFCINSCSLDFK